MKVFAAGLLAALCLVSVVQTSSAASGSRPTVTLLGTTLTDASNNVIGGAGFQSVTRGSTTKTSFEVGVCNLSQAQGTTLNILVNGTQVATATVKSRGSRGKAGVLLFSSRGDTVPAVVAGDTISVQTTAGAVIATGTFQKFR